MFLRITVVYMCVCVEGEGGGDSTSRGKALCAYVKVIKRPEDQ